MLYQRKRLLEKYALFYLSFCFSGGFYVVFSGTNLNVTQSPVIKINDSRFQPTEGVSHHLKKLFIFTYHCL